MTAKPKTWNLSCPDWVTRLRSGKSLVPDLPLDMVAAERAVQVFNRLRLADVPGTPTMAEAGADWFRSIVRAIFGSYDAETRERMIREVFALVPKKNSKTTDGALLMLTALLLNERPNAPMGLTSPVQDTSQIAFDAIAGAVELDPVLERKLHVRHHIKTIVHRETGATLEVMTFDPSALTGPKWAAFMVDELHVISERSQAARSLRQIRGGMLPYPEAFLFIITTQSERPPSGVFDAELTKARAIRDGTQTGKTLPVLYEFPADMQKDVTVWQNPKNWPMVTPNVGKSISISRLEEEFKDAKSKSDEEVRAWASQHLNVEIGLALSCDSWAGALFWEPQGDKTLTLDELLKRSEVVVAGIDGGGLSDLLGLCILGRETGTGNWLHWTRAWAHNVALQRHKKNEGVYDDFQKDGDLVVVSDMGDDVEEVADIIEKCEKTGLLDCIGVDQSGVQSIVDAIIARDIDIERIVGISQGWKLVGAIKSTERRLAEGALYHGATRMMAWCVGNAKVEPAGNAIKITKQVSGSAKIDPLMALFDAVALMSRNPESRKSNYDIYFV